MVKSVSVTLIAGVTLPMLKTRTAFVPADRQQVRPRPLNRQVLVYRQLTRQRDRPCDAKIDRVARCCGRNRRPQAARAAVIEIRDRERRRHPRARAEQDETDNEQHALQCGEGELQHNNDQASG